MVVRLNEPKMNSNVPARLIRPDITLRLTPDGFEVCHALRPGRENARPVLGGEGPVYA